MGGIPQFGVPVVQQEVDRHFRFAGDDHSIEPRFLHLPAKDPAAVGTHRGTREGRDCRDFIPAPQRDTGAGQRPGRKHDNIPVAQRVDPGISDVGQNPDAKSPPANVLFFEFRGRGLYRNRPGREIGIDHLSCVSVHHDNQRSLYGHCS